jgi:hypothetical protein
MRYFLIIVALFVRVSTAIAQSDQAPSPRQALLAQDAAAHSGNLESDASFYYAADDHQRKMIKAIAEGDVALAKLENAVAKKFGPHLATALVHAAGTVVADDVKSASEKIEGDKATVQFKNNSLPLHLVKIDGAWKVSLPDMLGEATLPQVEQLTAKFSQFTAEINNLTELVTQNKFRSGEGVRDRVTALHDRLFKPASDEAEAKGV